ncbi:MAG TPA: urease accessory protein UreF [Flavobacteriaceae bacterium]|nr:urease accessory protein UreF [Flavobacteriaceae bacterium]
MTEAVNLLHLFQLCDSNFPNGGFTQSFGFETYINQEEIHNAETFGHWLDIFLRDQLVTSDGLGIRMAYDSIEQNELDKLWHIDRLLTVQNLARETREGTGQMGKSLINISIEIYDAPLLVAYQKRIKEGNSNGHPAIVFAIVGEYLKISKKKTIMFYLYSTMVNFIQNAVRAIPLGQTDGQRLLSSFHPKLQAATDKILNLDEIEFGTIAPGIELAQMQHERVTARMFMS